MEHIMLGPAMKTKVWVNQPCKDATHQTCNSCGFGQFAPREALIPDVPFRPESVKNEGFHNLTSVMSSTLDEPCKIAGDFDESACEFCERYKNSGLSNSSRTLLSLILDDGIQNKSVLDLGCGAGGFSIEALKQGGGSSIGIDLSPKMVETANQLAATNGLDGRAKFQQGNAASASLPPSDIVIMDKVICCYSDIGPLVKNASEATKNLLGFVVPRDDGVLKWPLRLGVWVMNRFEKRRGGLSFYLHRLDTLDRTLRDSGFVRQKKRGSRFWLVFLYKRVQ